MNYYEELGLPHGASESEIRQAYKTLARLVHPDRQADEKVRGMAERQMQRLNEVLATLTDPRKRLEYDDSLLASPVALAGGTDGPIATAVGAKVAAMHRASPIRVRRQPEPWRTHLPEWVNVMLLNWFWIVMAVVILGVGWWYVAADNSRQTATATAAVVTPDQPQPAAQAARSTPRSEAQPVSGDSADAPAADSELSSKTSPPLEAVDAPLRAVTSEPLPVVPFSAQVAETVPAALAAQPEPANTSARSPSAAPSFAGNWLYVPENGNVRAPGAYPATYVELLLTEAHGELSGGYRARFKVPDIAVSPEVSFRVHGKAPSGESAKLGWTAADGSRGELEMTLRAPNVVSVTWWATELGRHAGLASGTANLVRQQVP
jgi:hypothetical protein